MEEKRFPKEGLSSRKKDMYLRSHNLYNNKAIKFYTFSIGLDGELTNITFIFIPIGQTPYQLLESSKALHEI